MQPVLTVLDEVLVSAQRGAPIHIKAFDILIQAAYDVSQ